MSNENSKEKEGSDIWYNILAFCIGFCIAVCYPTLTATALLLSDFNTKDK